jgi:hypothetical protein
MAVMQPRRIYEELVEIRVASIEANLNDANHTGIVLSVLKRSGRQAVRKDDELLAAGLDECVVVAPHRLRTEAQS